MNERQLLDYFYHLTTGKSFTGSYNFLANGNSVMKTFHIGYLDDLNGERLESIYITGQTKAYPALICPPPLSFLSPEKPEYEQFNLTLYFMDLQGSYNDNRPKSEQIEKVWFAMAEVARDYFIKLNEACNKQEIPAYFVEGQTFRVDRIRDYGKDKLSGVRLDLAINIHMGCDTVTEFS